MWLSRPTEILVIHMAKFYHDAATRLETDRRMCVYRQMTGLSPQLTLKQRAAKGSERTSGPPKFSGPHRKTAQRPLSSQHEGRQSNGQRNQATRLTSINSKASNFGIVAT